LLELALALGLAVVSAGVFLAGLALVLWVLMTVYMALFRVSPILAYGVMTAGAGLSVKVATPVMRLCWKGLAAIWRPFLTYYRYEAHTLRPLTKNETTIPGDGREKNEG
jgi:hypothetical protein